MQGAGTGNIVIYLYPLAKLLNSTHYIKRDPFRRKQLFTFEEGKTYC